MAKSAPKIIRYFLAAGFLFPCLLFFVIEQWGITVGGTSFVLLILWPSFPFIMAAEGGGGSFGILPAFLVSALANVLVYGLLGCIVSFAYRRLFFRPT
jgi:hypothetical protein